MPDLPLSTLLALPPSTLAAKLPSFLGGYMTPETRPGVITGLERVCSEASEAEWVTLLEHMRTLGEAFEAFRIDPLAARITHGWLDPMLAATSTISGLEHLDAGLEAVRRGRRLMIVGNHLSYVDANALGHLLLRAGRPDVRQRICAVAGPKAYSDPMRRVAVAGLNSIKVAQSREVATGQVALSRREIVRIARRSLELAGQVMDDGLIIVIYPEGTRSRSGRLQPFLRATNRWLSLENVVLLPSALWGTGAFDRRPAASGACHGRFGPLLDGAELELGRDGLLEAAHDAVAALLPDGSGPEPGAPKTR